MNDHHITDFTIENYNRLLKILSKRYQCIQFDDNMYQLSDNERYCLWRHDVDFSIDRAVILADYESRYGIKANYFIQLSSNFYNVFDPVTRDKIQSILRSGHAIGLHFSPEPYTIENKKELVDKLTFEKNVLESILDQEVRSLSFHNPTPDMLQHRDRELCGMHNVYSDFIIKHFTYCSDSNGYWRYRRLEETLNDDNYHIHVLTHPVWWQDEPMNPRDRIAKQIIISGDNLLLWYDDILSKFNRPNIGLKNGE